VSADPLNAAPGSGSADPARHQDAGGYFKRNIQATHAYQSQPK